MDMQGSVKLNCITYVIFFFFFLRFYTASLILPKMTAESMIPKRPVTNNLHNEHVS